MNKADGVSIYVKGTWTVANVQGNPSMNVYVLPKGTLNWGLYAWKDGQLNIGDGKSQVVKCWGTINLYLNGTTSKITSVQVKANSKLYLFDGDMDELYVAKTEYDQGGTLFVETGSFFYSSIPVTLAGNFDASNGGDITFANTFLCLGDAYIKSGSTYIFGKCSTINGSMTLSGGNTKIYVEEELKVDNLSIDGCKLYLKNAIVNVNNTTTMYAAGNEGRIVGENLEYRSVLNTGKLVLNAYQPTNPQITTLSGNLDVLLKKSTVVEKLLMQRNSPLHKSMKVLGLTLLNTIFLLQNAVLSSVQKMKIQMLNWLKSLASFLHQENILFLQQASHSMKTKACSISDGMQIKSLTQQNGVVTWMS